MSGTLYGLGIGPGDPELLTAKAIRLLTECPVLAWPATLEGEGMARQIAAQHIPAGKTEIAIRLSFRPERDDTDAAYDQAAAEIAAHLEAGRDVALLCEGDPLFFGSFIYVFTRLAGRFPIEIVPGVSSVMAAAALAQHPLSTLDDSLAIIPATRAEADIARVLDVAESFVIMKVGRHLAKIRRLLEQRDLLGKALLVERVGLPGQKISPLAEMAEAPYFSLILVHR